MHRIQLPTATIALLISLCSIFTVVIEHACSQNITDSDSEDRVTKVRWADFTQSIRRAKISHSPSTKFEIATSGGVKRASVFQHAGAPGQPLATIDFPKIALPAIDDGVQKIELRFALGFRDGDAFRTAKSDGCQFIINVDGKQVFRKDYAKQAWSGQSVDLSKFAGQEVEVQFQVSPGKHSAADWALWGTPEIWLTGQADALRSLTETGIGLPEHWPIESLAGDHSTNYGMIDATERRWIGSLDHHLDLHLAVRNEASKYGDPPVPLAPRIVVGQGESAGNHTVVKVLDEYGLTSAQFLSFPAKVKGGVWVERLRSEKGSPQIATTPITNGNAEIRVFSLKGELLRTFHPNGIVAPFVLASGDFLESSRGEELAVASAVDAQVVLVLSGHGMELSRIGIQKVRGPVQLIAKRSSSNEKPASSALQKKNDSIWIYGKTNQTLQVVSAKQNKVEVRDLPFLPSGRSVFPTVFDNDRIWAGGPQKIVSHVYDIHPNNTFAGKNVGQEENQFWIALPKEFEQDFGPLQNKTQARHIRLCEYGHIRVDAMSPKYANPSAAAYAGNGFRRAMEIRGLNRPLTQQPLRMWNPCFTHRAFGQTFRNWAEEIDPVTNLPANMMQSYAGGMDGYTIGSKPTGLISATYATGNQDLQDLYAKPLRAFLKMWAPLYREHPHLVPSIEPNHEHEIAIASHGSVGDYNPAMIRGFFHWLKDRYGSDIAGWRRPLGVNFKEYFDAPRGLDRAAWDRYDLANPYFIAWVEYNRYVVNRTLALTYREALLAGVPPEIIHCHQIPARYAVGPLLHGVTRITPIDYAMWAGVGFGFTKFGVNSEKPDNIIKLAKRSGFDSFVMGEYQPLTTDKSVADNELRYVFNNGARAIHVLHWGVKHKGGNQEEDPTDLQRNKTVYDSIQRLIAEDPPRRGQAGGLTQIRTFVDRDRRFNVVALGSGEDQRGLLKSVKANGQMEGTVYVSPFHSHVGVMPLDVKPNLKNGLSILLPQEIQAGNQLSINVSSTKATPQQLHIEVLRGGNLLTGISAMLTVAKGKPAQYRLRFPDRQTGLSCRLRGAGPNVQVEARLLGRSSETPARPHRGGVTFDLID